MFSSIVDPCERHEGKTGGADLRLQPPERPREIELLVPTLVAAVCRQLDRAVPLAASPAAFDRLCAYASPGALETRALTPAALF
jgi:hypothetical protein